MKKLPDKTPSKISDLIPDDKNFNRGSEYGNSLIEKSFRKFGAGRSILIDKNNRIIAGNKSVENAGAIGIEDVQVVESDGKRLIAVKRTDIDLDTPEGREMALSDNATAKANIIFDAELIEAEVGEAVMVEWGVEVAKKEITEDDFDSVPPKNPITVLGDLYELNKHRVHCGDSTDAEVVEKLMNGEKADICFTSPPYNMGSSASIVGNKHTAKRKSQYENNNDKKVDYLNFLNSFLSLALENSNAVSVNIQMLANNKIDVLEWVLCNKNNFNDVLVWNKENGAPAIHSRCLTSVFEFIFIFSKSNKKIIPFADWHGLMKNVYTAPPQRNNEFSEHHGATFPIHLPAFVIGSLMNKCESVYDPFLGSGTTLIAAEQLNRTCYGQEISPSYCDIIVARWVKFMGEKEITVKRNGQTLSKDEIEKYLQQINPE